MNPKHNSKKSRSLVLALEATFMAFTLSSGVLVLAVGVIYCVF